MTNDTLEKSFKALRSAKALLELNDYDGACDRAYYAMFHAAREALEALLPSITPESIRTHNGLITAFSLHLVKTGRISVEMGRSLNKVQELRLIADYRNESLDAELAEWAVEHAELFVHSIKDLLTKSKFD